MQEKDEFKVEPLTQVEKEILEKAREAIAQHVIEFGADAEEEIDRIQMLMFRDYLLNRDRRINKK